MRSDQSCATVDLRPAARRERFTKPRFHLIDCQRLRSCPFGLVAGGDTRVTAVGRLLTKTAPYMALANTPGNCPVAEPPGVKISVGHQKVSATP